ncbi:MAG: hypothetical protein A2015_11165 [Spirochaetes bacterium GWF1_31_7]|nr:MAG: hypothetical protein A2Y30_02400 [Spirochaetes bacterium GWE1_32_154]OHD47759.1 MAG: hypothetical protein A2015_11165 [Spirochaetes bacterium GWF1_31_7]OHD73301.1 MAG: hypothetical protein A2355_01510 [Spirochaetes bacterium RIFOXYB1_FULL_32_8]HBD95611.1 hypothetical protein [Spirochaetia bacterium]HBI37476.1 hypothetical protein [Spirochaetia bacterium]
MFLKKLTINGFKSFCDHTDIVLDKGISAIVGPNGCGKSNIVDALKWVLGEQKTKALRANNMTDVIFKGTVDKKGLGRAEVRLVLVNNDNILPVEFNDVEIARIIYANGENEFFINKEKVRLKDIHELFYDTGVGKTAYSFMEQGKIDMILSNKPEDRRYIIEEAAGITKYKSRKMEALTKLARADENILRVQDILSEVTKQYETMKKQAEKAEKYTLIQDKEISLEIEINVNRLTLQKKLQTDFSNRLQSSQNELNKILGEIESLQDIVSDKMVYLNNLENEKIDCNRQIIHLEGEIKLANSKSSMLRDNVINLNSTLKSDEEKIGVVERKIIELEDELEEADDSKYDIQERISSIMKDTDRYNENINQINIDLQKIEQIISDKKDEIKKLESLLIDKRNALKDVTDELIEKIEKSLNSFDINSKEIMTIKNNVESDIKNIITELTMRRGFLSDIVSSGVAPSNTGDFIKRLDEYNKQLKELEVKLTAADENVKKYIMATGVFMNDIFSPEGVLQRKRKIENEINDINLKIERNKKDIDDTSEEYDTKDEQKEKYKEMISESKLNLSTLNEKFNSLEKDILRIGRMKQDYSNNKNELTFSIKKSKDSLEEIRAEIDEVEYAHSQCAAKKRDIEKLVEELDYKIQDENARMSEQQKSIRSINESLTEKKSDIEKYHIKLAEVETTLANIYETFYENCSVNLKDYENKEQYKSGRDYSDIRKELTDLKSDKSSLGSVNLLAIQECKSLEERYNLLNEQLNDLKEAKKDLLIVIDELNAVSVELFVKTYNEIRKNFHAIFIKLFNGGSADITLTNPENILETGIEITAQPPGQNSKSITLLSGGQRTMTAIALMFATFQVKPSPFCLLDEIDAALDEMNVTRLINLLAEFEEQTQFIMITHNKKTMSAANVLHGVTQESMGVSKIVSTKFIEKVN